MKFSHVVPLAALSSAFVLPPEKVLSDLKIEDHHRHGKVGDWVEEAVSTKDHVLSSFKEQYEEVIDSSKHRLSEVGFAFGHLGLYRHCLYKSDQAKPNTFIGLKGGKEHIGRSI